jgi:hypothetical protein
MEFILDCIKPTYHSIIMSSQLETTNLIEKIISITKAYQNAEKELNDRFREIF